MRGMRGKEVARPRGVLGEESEEMMDRWGCTKGGDEDEPWACASELGSVRQSRPEAAIFWGRFQVRGRQGTGSSNPRPG